MNDRNDRSVSSDDSTPRNLTPRWLRGVFVDLLARPPYREERDRWLGQPVSELVDALLERLEFWEEWLQSQLYYFLLVDNFRPESASILRLPRELRDGTVGVRDALFRIALSASFDRRNPGADTFVTVVMEQFLGIAVQKNARQLEIGKHVYEGKSGRFLGITGDTQADVVRIAIDDERCLLRFVEREYKRYILIPPEKKAALAYSANLRQGDRDYKRLVRSWLNSPAYAERFERRVEITNRVFARSLYVDLFDRLPDIVEVRRIRSALDGLGDAAPLRSALIRILLDSGKVELPDRASIASSAQSIDSWIAQSFVRLYGREPSDDERSVFRESFGDPSCRPETVLYALLSHPEYATR